jgi:hypothetical protein
MKKLWVLLCALVLAARYDWPAVVPPGTKKAARRNGFRQRRNWW